MCAVGCGVCFLCSTPEKRSYSNKHNKTGNLQGLPTGIIALIFGTLVAFMFSGMKTESVTLPTGESAESLKGCWYIWPKCFRYPLCINKKLNFFRSSFSRNLRLIVISDQDRRECSIRMSSVAFLCGVFQIQSG